MKPIRVQLSRKKGWRKPANTVVVARPTKWGNPFKVTAGGGRETAVRDFERWLADLDGGGKTLMEAKRELRGKNLACWCPLGQPCHADILLEWANKG